MNDSGRGTDEQMRAYEEAARRRPWTALYDATFAASPGARGTALDAFRAVRPERPAIWYFDGALDYGALDRLSDGLAAWWAANGVLRGDRIGLILQNTPEFVIGVLAAWKLAAIPVSLNPMYRKPELERLFADCEPRALLCHADQWPTVLEASRGSVQPDLVLWSSSREFQRRDDGRILPAPADTASRSHDLSTILGGQPASPPPCVLGPQDVGLVLYTSGTTGAPKGAMLTHANLVHNAEVCRSVFALGPHSRIFGLAPLFHITGFEVQMVAAFAAGASLVLTYRFHPAVVLDAFVEHRPTFIIGAITAFIALMNRPEATQAHFDGFDRIYSGGAPIAPAVIDAFALRFGRAIRTSYGMTELTAPSHLAPGEGRIPVDPSSGALSIGVPTVGVDAIIVDDRRVPLPQGEHGELVVRGPQVMEGYWGKPAETAEALTQGWMHTGDIGFFDAQGWFYLVDRKKDMIAVSGFKVWPREVEDALYAFPGVREAAVIGAADAYRGETVVAYVSAETGIELDVDAMSRFCRERLAAYKCPARIMVVPDLPKTATGKIMRGAIKQWMGGPAREIAGAPQMDLREEGKT